MEEDFELGNIVSPTTPKVFVQKKTRKLYVPRTRIIKNSPSPNTLLKLINGMEQTQNSFEKYPIFSKGFPLVSYSINAKEFKVHSKMLNKYLRKMKNPVHIISLFGKNGVEKLLEEIGFDLTQNEDENGHEVVTSMKRPIFSPKKKRRKNRGDIAQEFNESGEPDGIPPINNIPFKKEKLLKLDVRLKIEKKKTTLFLSYNGDYLIFNKNFQKLVLIAYILSSVVVYCSVCGLDRNENDEFCSMFERVILCKFPNQQHKTFQKFGKSSNLFYLPKRFRRAKTTKMTRRTPHKKRNGIFSKKKVSFNEEIPSSPLFTLGERKQSSRPSTSIFSTKSRKKTRPTTMESGISSILTETDISEWGSDIFDYEKPQEKLKKRRKNSKITKPCKLIKKGLYSKGISNMKSPKFLWIVHEILREKEMFTSYHCTHLLNKSSLKLFEKSEASPSVVVLNTCRREIKEVIKNSHLMRLPLLNGALKVGDLGDIIKEQKRKGGLLSRTFESLKGKRLLNIHNSSPIRIFNHYIEVEGIFFILHKIVDSFNSRKAPNLVQIVNEYSRNLKNLVKERLIFEYNKIMNSIKLPVDMRKLLLFHNGAVQTLHERLRKSLLSERLKVGMKKKFFQEVVGDPKFENNHSEPTLLNKFVKKNLLISKKNSNKKLVDFYFDNVRDVSTYTTLEEFKVDLERFKFLFLREHSLGPYRFSILSSFLRDEVSILRQVERNVKNLRIKNKQEEIERSTKLKNFVMKKDGYSGKVKVTSTTANLNLNHDNFISNQRYFDGKLNKRRKKEKNKRKEKRKELLEKKESSLVGEAISSLGGIFYQVVESGKQKNRVKFICLSNKVLYDLHYKFFNDKETFVEFIFRMNSKKTHFFRSCVTESGIYFANFEERKEKKKNSEERIVFSKSIVDDIKNNRLIEELRKVDLTSPKKNRRKKIVVNISKRKEKTQTKSKRNVEKEDMYNKYYIKEIFHNYNDNESIVVLREGEKENTYKHIIDYNSLSFIQRICELTKGNKFILKRVYYIKRNWIGVFKIGSKGFVSVNFNNRKKKVVDDKKNIFFFGKWENLKRELINKWKMKYSLISAASNEKNNFVIVLKRNLFNENEWYKELKSVGHLKNHLIEGKLMNLNVVKVFSGYNERI